MTRVEYILHPIRAIEVVKNEIIARVKWPISVAKNSQFQRSSASRMSQHHGHRIHPHVLTKNATEHYSIQQSNTAIQVFRVTDFTATASRARWQHARIPIHVTFASAPRPCEYPPKARWSLREPRRGRDVQTAYDVELDWRVASEAGRVRRTPLAGYREPTTDNDVKSGSD